MTNEIAALLPLSTGVSLPSLFTVRDGARANFVFAHGLGSTNPFKRGHHNDRWIDIAKSSVENDESSILIYTARGHGDSTGWESSAETNSEQFTWKFLALDMHAVADYYNISNFIAGGSSMGSATALYAAIREPSRVTALILIRPPTAWQERADRRKYLLASAERLKERIKSATTEDHSSARSSAVHFVLQGTAYSDLPPIDSEEYRRIAHIPTLILTIQGDPAHPVSTTEKLHRLLPLSQFHIAETVEAAAEAWPALIRQFVSSLK